MVKVKYIKNIGQYVFSIGFPVSSFENSNTNGEISIKQQLLNIGGQITENDDLVEFTNTLYPQGCFVAKA